MIVFLDIDGVLKLDWGKVQWTKHCINVLNTLTRELKLKYVVTSTWRVSNTKEEMQRIFIQQGIIGEMIVNGVGDISECDFDYEWDEFKHVDRKYPICPECGGGVEY